MHRILACLALLASPVAALEANVTIAIPRLEVAEYHRPYVAAWIEKPDGKVTANLTVWYDVAMKDGEGETWLKDLRQWWRKSGRSVKMPVDGVSSPTRPVGTHTIKAAVDRSAMPALSEGEYVFVVEAVREVGGREMIRVPFKWDGNTPVEAAGKGKSELGEVKLSLEPEKSK